MQVELTRCRVRKGQEERAVEWMRFLRQNMDAVDQTLAPEKCMSKRSFRRFVMSICTCTGTVYRVMEHNLLKNQNTG